MSWWMCGNSYRKKFNWQVIKHSQFGINGEKNTKKLSGSGPVTLVVNADIQDKGPLPGLLQYVTKVAKYLVPFLGHTYTWYMCTVSPVLAPNAPLPHTKRGGELNTQIIYTHFAI